MVSTAETNYTMYGVLRTYILLLSSKLAQNLCKFLVPLETQEKFFTPKDHIRVCLQLLRILHGE